MATTALALMMAFGASPEVFGEPKTPKPITGTVQEKINTIAEIIAEESGGILAVTYAEAPTHRYPTGEIHYGVHYNVFVIKRIELVTPADKEKIKSLVARILQLTTMHVLAPDPNYSHLGVQIFNPHTWSFGGHQRGYVYIYEFLKDDLLKVKEKASPDEWMAVGAKLRLVVVPE